MEMSVMIETKVRFGFRYRRARKKLKGSFKIVDTVAGNAPEFQNGNCSDGRWPPLPTNGE